jgi:hypothetical protein
MLEPCGYRQRAAPLRHLAGPPIPSFWCSLKNCTTIEKAHPWLQVAGCDGCQERDLEAIVAAIDLLPGWITCDKRGQPTGDEVACQCSIDRRIFECNHKANEGGRCLKRLPPGGRIESLGKIMDGTAVCAECQIWNTENET